MTDVGPAVWSPDGTRLAIAGANQGPIRIYDVSSGAEPLVLSGHESGSWDAEFIGDGDRLASVGQFGELRVWDVSRDGPAALGAIAPVSGSPWSLDMSPDGAEVIVSTTGQTIERLSAQTGEQLATRGEQLVGLLPFGAPVSPDGRFVASTNQADGAGAVLDAKSLQPIVALPPCASPIAFSDDGSMLALDGRKLCVPGSAASFDPPADAELRSRIVEVDSGREILDLGEDWIGAALFNPPGQFAADRYVVVNVDFRRLDFYDLVEHRLIDSLHLTIPVYKTELDPTGRWLVGSGDGRFWVLDFVSVVRGRRGGRHRARRRRPRRERHLRHRRRRDAGHHRRRAGAVLEPRHGSAAPRAAHEAADGPGVADVHTRRRIPAVQRRRHAAPIPTRDRRTHPSARSLLTRELTPDECRTYLDGNCA